MFPARRSRKLREDEIKEGAVDSDNVSAESLVVSILSIRCCAIVVLEVLIAPAGNVAQISFSNETV